MKVEARNVAVWLFYNEERWEIMHMETNKIPNKFQTKQNQKINLFSHVSNAPGAVTSITTRLLPINAPAIALTSIMLPLDAGNLPRIT